MISRSSTDLPVPLPPISATSVPRPTVNDTPSCTVWAPKRVTTSSTSMTGALIRSSACSSTAKAASSRITATMLCTTVEVVAAPSARVSRPTVMPMRAPMTAMTSANTGALTRPTTHMAQVERLAQARQEGGRRDVEHRPGDRHRADQAHHVADEDEQRQRQHQRQHARQHQHLHRRQAERADGVGLFGQPHRAELGREGRAGAAGDDDGDDDRRELARRADAHAVDDEDVGAVLLGLQAEQVGHDDADQHRHQGHHRDRRQAGLLELHGELAQAQPARAAQHVEQRDQRGAEEVEMAVQQADQGGGLAPEVRQHAGRMARGRLGGRLELAAHLLDDAPVDFVEPAQRRCVEPRAAQRAPQHQRGGAVDLFERAAVDGGAGGERQGRSAASISPSSARRQRPAAPVADDRPTRRA